VNCRLHPLTGKSIDPEQEISDDLGDDDDNDGRAAVEAFVSWPAQGKHLSFDGRYLHAAPSDLMEDGAFQRQCALPFSEDNDDIRGEKRKRDIRRHRRVVSSDCYLTLLFLLFTVMVVLVL